MIAIGLLVLVLDAAAAGGAHPAASAVRTQSIGIPPGGGSSVNVTVHLTDAPSFDPSYFDIPGAGVTHFQLVNTGLYNHSFTVSDVAGYVLPTNWTPPQLNAWFAANGSMTDTPVPAGTTVYLNLSVPASDVGNTYEFVSLVPYQFQAGMRGFLNVTTGASGAAVPVTEQTNDQLRFVPDTLVVNATSYPVRVAVQITNIGSSPHTFTLEGQSNNTLNPGNFTQYFSAHAPLADVALNSAGATVWANFTVTKPGVFEYVCRVPAHFAGGMFGWLYVGVAPPPSAAPPATGIVQVGILIGAGSLLGVGLLFTLAGAYTGRFSRSPPPSGH